MVCGCQGGDYCVDVATKCVVEPRVVSKSSLSNMSLSKIALPKNVLSKPSVSKTSVLKYPLSNSDVVLRVKFQVGSFKR